LRSYPIYIEARTARAEDLLDVGQVFSVKNMTLKTQRVAFVLVSLITAPESLARTRDFFNRLDVSTDHTRDLIDLIRAAGREHEVQGLPEKTVADLARKTAETGDQFLLTNLAQLRTGARGVPFLQAYRNDLFGLAACWVVVAVLVGLAWAILQMG
jgi:hypothetical protein